VHELRIAARRAELLRDALAAFARDVVDDHRAAFLGKAHCDAFSKPRARAGDDRNLAGQPAASSISHA
jgi:hypothetical protein